MYIISLSLSLSLSLSDDPCPSSRLKDKCGMRASPTAELVFDDLIIPEGNLVGDAGGATVCMMRNLEIERVVLAAMGVRFMYIYRWVGLVRSIDR